MAYPKHNAYGMMLPSAPRATGGKRQPITGKVKAPKAAKPPKAPGKAPARPPAIPQAPAGVSDQALINAAVRTRFSPQEQALKAQLGQNARFASGTGDWYTQALNEIKGLRDQGAAASQQTLGRITAYNSQPTLANGNDQAAAGARNNLNSEYAAKFGANATANSDAMNRLAAGYAIQQGNTLNQTNAARQQLLAQQGTLGQQKADYGLSIASSQASAQTKNDIEMKKIQAGIYIAQGKNDMAQKVLNSLNANRTQQQKVARTNARTNQAAQALAVGKEARQAYLDAHPELRRGAKNANGRTQGEATAHHKIIRAVDNATEDVTRGRQNKLSDKAIRGAMQLNKIPNDVINAAFARADNKPLSAGDINRLRNAGLIAAPRRWKKGNPTVNLGTIVQGALQKLGQ